MFQTVFDGFGQFWTVLDSLVRGLQRFAPGILGVLRLTGAQVWPVTVLSHVRRCQAMLGHGQKPLYMTMLRQP